MNRRLLMGLGTLVALALAAFVVWGQIGRHAQQAHVSVQARATVNFDASDQAKLLQFDVTGQGDRMIRFRLRRIQAGQGTVLGDESATTSAPRTQPAPAVTFSNADLPKPWEGDVHLLLERTRPAENRDEVLRCRSRYRCGGAALYFSASTLIDPALKLAAWQSLNQPNLAPSVETPIAVYYYTGGRTSVIMNVATVSLPALETQSKELDGFILVLTAEWE